MARRRDSGRQKDPVMVGRISTGYEQRVKVAADALVQQLNLGEELAVAYAKWVMNAVEHIPERGRGGHRHEPRQRSTRRDGHCKPAFLPGHPGRGRLVFPAAERPARVVTAD